MAVDITTLGWGTVQDRYGNALSGVPFTVTQGSTTVLSGVTDTNGQIVGSVAAGVYTLVVGGVTKTVDAASGAGGGGGAVSSVNGAVGVVVLAAADVGAQPADSDLTALAGIAPANDDLVQRKAGAWTNRTPAQVKTDLTLVKGDVGLGNVDNTSDVNKPVSTAQAAADALALAKASNLSDLANAGTARTNLGLGSAATQASSAFEAAGAVAAAKGLPLALAGATAATRYVGGTTSGAPASGAFVVGDFVIDQTGKVYVCTTAGSPGTWTLSGGSSAASGVTFTPAGTIAATDVQAAIAEAASEAAQKSANLSDIASAITARTNLGVGADPSAALSGQYFSPAWVVSSGTATQTLNKMFAQPILLAAGTLDRIAITHQGSATASEVCRLGIYANGAGNYPGALLIDGGTVDLSTATAIKAVTISLAITGGLYWLVAVRQGPTNTATLGVLNNNNIGQSVVQMPVISTTFYQQTAAYVQTGVTGALPGTFTSTVTLSTSDGTVPLIAARRV